MSAFKVIGATVKVAPACSALVPEKVNVTVLLSEATDTAVGLTVPNTNAPVVTLVTSALNLTSIFLALIAVIGNIEVEWRFCHKMSTASNNR
jgi:hypothetical protein